MLKRFEYLDVVSYQGLPCLVIDAHYPSNDSEFGFLDLISKGGYPIRFMASVAVAKVNPSKAVMPHRIAEERIKRYEQQRLDEFYLANC